MSESSISTLIKKEILVKNTLEIERVSAKKTSDIKVYSLSIEQNNAYKSIKNHWKIKMWFYCMESRAQAKLKFI